MRSENEGEESTNPERYYEIPTHISHKSEKNMGTRREKQLRVYVHISLRNNLLYFLIPDKKTF